MTSALKHFLYCIFRDSSPSALHLRRDRLRQPRLQPNVDDGQLRAGHGVQAPLQAVQRESARRGYELGIALFTASLNGIEKERKAYSCCCMLRTHAVSDTDILPKMVSPHLQSASDIFRSDSPSVKNCLLNWYFKSHLHLSTVGSCQCPLSRGKLGNSSISSPHSLGVGGLFF